MSAEATAPRGADRGEAFVPRVLNRRHYPRNAIPEGAVNVSRPTKWGNPFRVGGESFVPQSVLDRYEEHLRSKPELMAALGELRGKDLACWCKPLNCHGDVLLRLANGPEGMPK